jgi:hypothetical protein
VHLVNLANASEQGFFRDDDDDDDDVDDDVDLNVVVNVVDKGLFAISGRRDFTSITGTRTSIQLLRLG